jgi:RNA polymerase sigma-70 factor (ECF subfamily)
MLVVTEREPMPVQEARAGKSEAWDVLWKRYHLPLYTFAYELVRNEQAALDIVQEAFIAAARHIGGLRDDDRFGSWLFGIAHQKCVQRWRKAARETVPLDERDDDFPDAYAGPEELLIRKEQEELLMKFLDQLTPPHRAVLLLHFLEDFSLEEIARVTDSGVGTVKSRLHYAKKSLRKLLEDDQT